MWGIKYSTKKRQHMSLHTACLGNVYNWDEWDSLLAVTFGMNQTTNYTSYKLRSTHIASYKLTRTEANKLMGALTMGGQMTYWPPLSMGTLTALVARPYYENKSVGTS